MMTTWDLFVTTWPASKLAVNHRRLTASAIESRASWVGSWPGMGEILRTPKQTLLRRVGEALADRQRFDF